MILFFSASLEQIFLTCFRAPKTRRPSTCFGNGFRHVLDTSRMESTAERIFEQNALASAMVVGMTSDRSPAMKRTAPSLSICDRQLVHDVMFDGARRWQVMVAVVMIRKMNWIKELFWYILEKMVVHCCRWLLWISFYTHYRYDWLITGRVERVGIRIRCQLCNRIYFQTQIQWSLVHWIILWPHVMPMWWKLRNWLCNWRCYLTLRDIFILIVISPVYLSASLKKLKF